MNRLRTALLLTVITAVILLAGCVREQNPTSTTAPTAAAGGAKYTIAVIPKGTSQSYWLAVKAGAEAAAAESGAQIQWDGPAQETDIPRQISILQNAITRKVSAIVMAACDAKGLVAYVKDAKAAKIPVVTIDSGLEPDVSDAFLATDNVKGGQIAADELAKAVGNKGKVGLLPFIKNAGSSDDRESGFKQGLAKYPGLDLGNRTLYSNSDVNQAIDKANAMVTATPDIAGIFAANQSGAEGAIQAIKQSGKAGKVKLVCYDSSDPEIAALKDGTVSALIVQNPYRMGYEGVRTAVGLIKGTAPAQHKIDTGVTVITAKNINDAAVQKVLNPTK